MKITNGESFVKNSLQNLICNFLVNDIPLNRHYLLKLLGGSNTKQKLHKILNFFGIKDIFQTLILRTKC